MSNFIALKYQTLRKETREVSHQKSMSSEMLYIHMYIIYIHRGINGIYT